jgi:hypothetical protein
MAADALGLGSGADASDMGGEGGPSMVETSGLDDDISTASGGVVMRGELVVDPGESAMLLSKVGDSGTDTSVEMSDR